MIIQIEKILEMLQLSEHLCVSEEVEIAKGKYHLDTTFKGQLKQKKRAIKFKNKDNGR